jgi:hypothetical protein
MSVSEAPAPPPVIDELLQAHRAVDEASAACDRAFRLSLDSPRGESRAARHALDEAERDLETALRRLASAREALEAVHRPLDEKSWGAH